ncbi:MAG TPA: hypothetical protein VKM94_25625 [Blastocatellia bacterium]|nr:hypothetical protein [Blastocatellia bacterium]
MSEEFVGLRFDPVHTLPRRLLVPVRVVCEFLDFGAFSFYGLVAAHAGVGIRDSSVCGFVSVFVAEGAFELGAVRFGDVLPMIKGDWLSWRTGVGQL